MSSGEQNERLASPCGNDTLCSGKTERSLRNYLELLEREDNGGRLTANNAALLLPTHVTAASVVEIIVSFTCWQVLMNVNQLNPNDNYSPLRST